MDDRAVHVGGEKFADRLAGGGLPDPKRWDMVRLERAIPEDVQLAGTGLQDSLLPRVSQLVRGEIEVAYLGGAIGVDRYRREAAR